MSEAAFEKNLRSAMFKLRQALENKQISGLLITDVEIAAILTALQGSEPQSEEEDAES